MWVLEARYKAEKVWYPVIWEETKEASGVIDYNINEEITVNTTAVINANNDTTTGMATIIPWVNAPKLIETTSIYSNKQALVWGVLMTWQKELSYPDDNSWALRTWTLSDEWGNIKFKIKTDWNPSQWNWFQFPVSWWYDLYIDYPIGASTFAIDVDLYLSKWWFGNDILLLSYTGVRDNNHYPTNFRYNFQAGDVIFVIETLRYYGSASSFTSNREWTIQVTKL